MQPALRISIPKPCREQFASFETVQGGGFCHACQKTVQDFTGMSDEEIVLTLQNAKGKICGRFRTDQIKTYNRMANPSVQISTLRGGLLSAALLLAGSSLHAQEISGKEKISADSTVIRSTIYGTVRSADDKSALPGVSVFVRKQNRGTVTDQDGRFSLPVNPGDIVEFSFIGMVSKEYKVPSAEKAGVDINLDMLMKCDVTGEVAIERLYTEKRSLWSVIKSWF